jgi:hypothetical protein
MAKGDCSAFEDACVLQSRLPLRICTNRVYNSCYFFRICARGITVVVLYIANSHQNQFNYFRLSTIKINGQKRSTGTYCILNITFAQVVGKSHWRFFANCVDHLYDFESPGGTCQVRHRNGLKFSRSLIDFLDPFLNHAIVPQKHPARGASEVICNGSIMTRTGGLTVGRLCCNGSLKARAGGLTVGRLCCNGSLKARAGGLTVGRLCCMV